MASLGNKGEIQPAFSTVALIDETRPEEEDPWALPELQDTGVKWSGNHSSVNKLPTLFSHHISHVFHGCIIFSQLGKIPKSCFLPSLKHEKIYVKQSSTNTVLYPGNCWSFFTQ